MRALPKPRPETLMLPADGTDLNELIGELQSSHGVPQYPQEYRITIKVATDRPERAERGERPERPERAAAQPDGQKEAPRRESAPSNGVKREKAPPPGRMAAGAEGDAPREGQPRKRSRRRGRGRGRGKGNNGAPNTNGNGGTPSGGTPPG